MAKKFIDGRTDEDWALAMNNKKLLEQEDDFDSSQEMHFNLSSSPPRFAQHQRQSHAAADDKTEDWNMVTKSVS